jgi:hypothetical protein
MKSVLSGLLNGSANKFIVSVLGAVATSLSTYYGTTKWEPMVFAVLTALATYVVPNLSKL